MEELREKVYERKLAVGARAIGNAVSRVGIDRDADSKITARWFYDQRGVRMSYERDCKFDGRFESRSAAAKQKAEGLP
jgi:hypothetical protein